MPGVTDNRTTVAADARLIFGLMAFAVGFSLVGNEIKAETTKATGTTGVLTVAGRVILGGFFATSLLVLISHAGAPGAEIGKGLATVASLSSVVVYGGPVWSKANSLFGSKPTTPLASAASTVSSDTTLATGISPTKALAG